MLGRKKTAYRNDALNVLVNWVPTIGERDLNLFGVLLKAQFDEQYRKGVPPIVAAVSIGSLFFSQCIEMLERRDPGYTKVYIKFAPWHGACAAFIVHFTDFLGDGHRDEVLQSLEKAKSIKPWGEDKPSLGDIITAEFKEACEISPVLKKNEK